jgi:hypothetical protein
MSEPAAWFYQYPGETGIFMCADAKAMEGLEEKGYILTPLYTHPSNLTDDAVRYQWLRNEYAHGRETYLAEGIPSGEKLDEYIDEQLKKSQEK